jgi:Na+/H+ antiporter NhaD/arsenite permease-like protein
MILTVLIFAVTYILIASEKIDKTLAALLGACAIIVFHAAPYEEVLQKIDLNVIFLIIGMMLIVNIMGQTGVFEWIAISIGQKSRGNGIMILIMFLVTTAVLSALLDNVTTVILIAPITILVCQILEIPATPILIMEAIFSNIGGTATLVGDPPNILIASRVGLTFNQFLTNLGPVVLIIAIVTLICIIPIFRKHMTVSPAAKLSIDKAHPKMAIINPSLLKKAAPIFLGVIVMFFLSRRFEIEPGIIALCGAVIMTLVCRIDPHSILSKVEWNTILFFIGLFMLVGALEISGVLELLATVIIDLSQGKIIIAALGILWACALLSAIVDNIPLVIAMIPVIQSTIPTFAEHMGITGMPEQIQTQITEPLFWALALGACLGGNGSIVGASANVIVSQIAKRNNYKITFWVFTKYGFPIMILSLSISSVYLVLRYFI